MSRRPLRIGLSARIYHPVVGATGWQSKSPQCLEQSGAQLINLALGGTLPQDIATQIEMAGEHVHGDYDRHSHAVDWVAGSGLAKLYPGAGGGRVVSIHHQAIRALGRELRVEARSSGDGLIEAIRLQGRPYVLGLQWHPEFHPPGSEELLDCTPILDEFLAAARGRLW